MAAPPNRVQVTLRPKALEIYKQVAAEMNLPLPTFLRQTLENGLPYMEQLLEAFHEVDPQQKLKLARDIQADLAAHVSGRSDQSD